MQMRQIFICWPDQTRITQHHRSQTKNLLLLYLFDVIKKKRRKKLHKIEVNCIKNQLIFLLSEGFLRCLHCTKWIVISIYFNIMALSLVMVLSNNSQQLHGLVIKNQKQTERCKNGNKWTRRNNNIKNGRTKKISNFIVCGPIEEALVKTIEMSAEISNNCIF